MTSYLHGGKSRSVFAAACFESEALATAAACPPNGLCTFCFHPASANIFLTRVNWKSLCEIFLPHMRKGDCSCLIWTGLIGGRTVSLPTSMCDGWWGKTWPFYLPYLHSPCDSHNLPQFAALWPSCYYCRNYPLLGHHDCLSFHSISVRFLLECRPIWVSPVTCPSCWVWQCHNSKFASWPSHWVSLGRKSNCLYTVCGHVLVFSLSVLLLSLNCSQVSCSSLSVFAQVNRYVVRVSSLVT